jgi:hypothetical protein
MEFKEFDSIIRLASNVTITEKVHGTNAQILITEELHAPAGEVPRKYIRAGSRTRWLTPEDDNYGFARFVEENKEELLGLGVGRHFGEWFGSGINSGYNMDKGEKQFALFDQRFQGKPLPKGVTLVPVLYQGAWRDGLVTETMTKLKLEGSKISPGFMKPEGIVIRFERNGSLFKHVFDTDEVKWTGTKKEPGVKAPELDISAFLDNLILEKVTSKDERLLREYPMTLPAIAKAYIAELEQEEKGLATADDDFQKAVRRGVYPWVKSQLAAKGYSA